MSLLDNQTKVNVGTAFYGTGGGGGSVSTFNTLSASTLTVSDVYGPGGVNDPFTADGGINVGGIGLSMGDNPIAFGAGSPGIVWSANDGIMTGVSSINGSAYPPAAALQVQSVAMLNTGIATLPQNSEGGPVPITEPFSTIVGKMYQASIKVTSEQLQPAGNPAASDHYSFVDPSAGIALTRSYSELSTIQAGGNPRGQTVFFNFHATAAASQLTAYNNVGTTQSTIIGFDNGYGCQIIQLTY